MLNSADPGSTGNVLPVCSQKLHACLPGENTKPVELQLLTWGWTLEKGLQFCVYPLPPLESAPSPTRDPGIHFVFLHASVGC